MRVGLVAMQDCFSSGIVSMLDVLRTAQAVQAEVDPSIALIETELVGNRRRVTAASGVILPTTRSLNELEDLDIVVIGAFGARTFEDVLTALATRDARAVVAKLAGRSDNAQLLAGACTGTFPLAEAGVLDDRHVTTSWWLGPIFRTRYAAVHLDLDAMVVADRNVITAGAAFAHIDLALRLLLTISPVLAETVANLLVIDPRPAQTSYIALDHIQNVDPIVLAFERYARANLAEGLDIASMAAAIGTSRRTLERRVTRSLGISPIVMVQRLRIERAVHLLRTTDQSVDQVAPQVGYANGSTLRALIRRRDAPEASC